MRKRLLAILLIVPTFIVVASPAIAGSIWHSDPIPRLASTGQVKDLNAYPNYGHLDGAADILYSTEFDSWLFDAVGHRIRGDQALVSISLVLDDHYGRPESDYQGRIEVNGVQVFSGRFVDLGVRHGEPFATYFENWRTVSFSIADPGQAPVIVSIYNDTEGPIGGDWIAIDWMRLAISA
jgi:hypothetical protein